MSVVRFAAVAALAVVASHSAWAGCYRVYGADQELIYRSTESPVDLSRQIHETLPQVLPGATLVFTLDHFGCDITLNNLPGAPKVEAAPSMIQPERGDKS